MRSFGWSVVMLVCAFISPLWAGRTDLATPQDDSTLPPPVVMTSQQDHQRVMDLLHITSLRPGADGRDTQAPNAANYDESKANPYPSLPEPLILRNGKRVTKAKIWWRQRRSEIIEDFDREIYGRVPKVTPKVKWEVTSTTRDMNGDVPVITKKLLGHVDNSTYPMITVDIQLTLTTPGNATGPVPVIMEFGFVFPPGSRPPTPQPTAPVPNGPTWQQLVLAKGWGYAVIIPNTIQADNGAPAGRWIILRPTSRLTPGKSVSRATRVMVRRRSSPWHMTSALPSRMSVLPARAAPSFIAATSVSW